MKVLIVVDVQYDFLPGGALAVPEGDAIIPVVNELMEKIDFVVATQDWHPLDHGSFADNHVDKRPGDVVDLNGLKQVLWPVHCVQNTHGAELENRLDSQRIRKIFTKGTDPGIDSYSGFYDNGHRKSTGLAEYLKEHGVDEVYVAGLAADYCVKFTALDAVKENFKTWLFVDATRAVNLKADDFDKAIREMQEKGVRMLKSADI
ncbi:MAG: bifunctional nicotinamidase/pyrazinamidase [Cyclobacteriaceae bacterium]|nr:bifunctional nicotinamidase/pyrazinamidase [Cyclobacteriaceae bacterium]